MQVSVGTALDAPLRPPWWRDPATWIVGTGVGLPMVGQSLLPPVGCPFKALTGWDCPLCGGTRAVEALVHGDLLAALDQNALVAVAVLLGLPAVLALLMSGSAERAARRIPWVLHPGLRPIAVLVVWTVLRNLDPTGMLLAGLRGAR